MKLLRCFADHVTPGPLMGLPRVAFVSAWDFWRGGDKQAFPTTERLHAIADESVGHLTMLDIECWDESRLPDYVRISDILHTRQPALRLGWFHGFPWCAKAWWWMGGRSAIEEPYGYHAQHGMAEKYWAIVESQRRTGKALQGHAAAVFPGCYLRNRKHFKNGLFRRFMLEKVRRCREDFGVAVYPVLFPRRLEPNPDYKGDPKKEPKHLFPTLQEDEWSEMLRLAAALEKKGTTAGTVIWDAPIGYAKRGHAKWTAKTPWVLAAAAAAEGVLP